MRILLDNPDRTFFSAPSKVLAADNQDQVYQALADAEAALAAGQHVAGWLAYELGYVLEPRLTSLMPKNVPLLRLGVFDAPSAFPSAPLGRTYVGPLSPEWDGPAYAKRFLAVKELLESGDIYQANLSFRSQFAFAGDALALYERLRSKSGAGHCAFVESVDADGTLRQIVSLSPELFFDLSKHGKITARPMKGTAPRGKCDEEARAELAASTKDRAENLMIVDLLRNDLGRIAEIGSVAVSNLFEVETYPTLHTMVSTITAQKRNDIRATDILRALFPCGSITGAPKIRAMEILRNLEDTPRGAYCGAIGHFSPEGSARFNVAIRTLAIVNGRGELGLGGGIVYDSREESEYAECMLKGTFFEEGRRPIQLIETLRHEGRFQRLESHLARMENSASVFGLKFNQAHALSALEGAVKNREGPLRVRLTLDEAGRHLATAFPLDANPSHWTYRISDDRVLSTDLLQQHKTNWRELYDSAPAEADEVLFCNERGELAEGGRSNIFLLRDGILLTPAISAGALDGRLRAELLSLGKAHEATLKPADLETGRLYCGNSLRGLIPAVPA